jgi:hypothetical protein
VLEKRNIESEVTDMRFLSFVLEYSNVQVLIAWKTFKDADL